MPGFEPLLSATGCGRAGRQLAVFVGVQVPVPVEGDCHRCDTGPFGDMFDGRPGLYPG